MRRRTHALSVIDGGCHRVLAILGLVMSLALALTPAIARAQNAIVTENLLAGSPAGEWDISGAGDLTLQGFATDISVNPGETVHFKIKTDAASYHIEIYRLGYYQGNGARHVGSGVVTATLPQTQPADLYDPVTGLTDCGNWAESAHWDVPAGAVSGIYLAKLTRDDTQGASHIVFVVRNDASHSAVLMKTSDCTWQAYNVYGGNSLYVGSVSGYPSGHAPKVSYNRPFYTRNGGGGGGAAEDWLFNAEYPMVRWLEANGYDVTYTTDVDTDRHGALLANHQIFMTAGHDEYWSAAERASVQSARDAGTNLAFFDGNEIYWKTRWETSTDGSGTPYRTLVCYKEGTLGENVCGGKCDPEPDVWTGLWRDGCAFTPPADGCNPENALSGQISWDGNTGTLNITDSYKNLRFWRNTAVATLGSGQSLDMTPGTLGYEWDWQQYADHYPAGRVQLSSTAFDGHTHHLSLYRAPSGALVFGAGTIQWSWGLDSHHDRGSDPPTLAMEQATVNLFADMGVQPATLQTGAGLVTAIASNDVTPPASVIGFPAAGASLPAGNSVTITGTASDVGGVVAGVEVSVDGGVTWQSAIGTTSWSFAWTPGVTGSVTIKSRAVDDLGNLETPGNVAANNVVTVTVTPGSGGNCPCELFAAEAPSGGAVSDNQPIELGVKFKASSDGVVTGVRFYKSTGNDGTHVGHLWSKTGTMLAEATFSGETASGWQTVTFSSPVAITAGTIYVASYHSDSFFSDDAHYFTTAHTTGPLTAIANTDPDGGNGVYIYSATSAFPNNSPGTGSFDSPNYWVDVVFDIPGGPDVTPPTVTATTPGNNATGVATNGALVATFSEALDPSTIGTTTFQLRDPANALVPASVSYDAPSHTATLTPGTLLAASTVYSAHLIGGATDPRIKDLAGNALAAEYMWTFTTAAPDLTPPTVTSTTPAANAGGVSPGVTVSAVFSEALSPASVTTSTFQLHDASNALVPAVVAYNSEAHTVTLQPDAVLASGSYTARLVGGATDPRIKDLAGNALAADVTWSFTVAGFTCPCTIWAPATVPTGLDEPDNSAVELGLKFHTTVAGYISGVRFYKSAGNTGLHVGNLWSRTGTLLATVNFTGESPSGWQEASFGSPVAVTANTTYLVSYHTNVGHYSDDQNFFLNSGLDSGPFHALKDGEDGPNGVYAQGGESGFPTQGFNQSNYWVDAVFNTSIAPDVTPPTIVASMPANGATLVSATAPLSVTFSEAIDPATVLATTVFLVDAGNATVPASVTYDVGTRTATLSPLATLAYSSSYTLRVKGGGTDPRIKDMAGNALAADYSASFTTASPPPPPPTEGPGGPILVISAASNPFSRYFVEILRAEGLDEFTAMDISLVTAGTLAGYDVVILGQMPLTASQVTMLSDWTNAGGTLIAMRPDAQLAGLLGITPASGTLSDKYLLVNTASGPGVGIVSQTIQFHGTADLYTANTGTTVVATLYSDASTATADPAVTMCSVGTNGGRAFAFAYDLARSIVYTRQGNPAWANQKRDGQIPPIRPDDQFFGNASFDPEPDWVDLNKVAIPQADEQQRLLANAILEGDLHRMPLPRFWYLPKGLKAAIVETGDDHGDAGMQPRFDIYRAESPANCSEPDWECVRATGYLYVGSTFTDAQALFYTNLGFEVALHVLTNCANFTQQEYQDFITSQVAAFHATFPSIPVPVTNRNHCIAWSDWSMTPEVESQNGIRFDANYYYWPQSWIQDRPGMFTGSGFPMRFAKLDGTIIDCFQAATEMPDESGETFPDFCDALLDKALGPEGYYGVFTTNMHFDNPNHPGSNAVVASALAHGVPVVSSKQMLDWLDGRNGSSFGSLTWSGHTLSFAVAAGAGARNLRAMLPAQSAIGQLTGLTLNGTPVATTAQTIKGIAYAFFNADPGNYVATYQIDTTPPVITAVTATPSADGTSATVTWTTDEPATSHVDYGTSVATLTLNQGSATLTTSHSVLLSSLTPGITYYYRVISADASNNSASSPVAPATNTFNTPSLACPTDKTAADFALGTLDANTAIATAGDGEVILKPSQLDQEFAGVALPADWHSANWNTGGTTVVGGGTLTVDGAHASSNATFGPNSALEFVATYTAAQFQNIGFAADSAFGSPWVVIGEGSATDGVYARTNPGTSVLLSNATLGTPHRYRIEWNGAPTNTFVFYVDGTLTATIPYAVGGPMLAMVSDFNTGGGNLSVDWVRVTPYAAAGTFTSRVFDGTGPTTWGAVTWTASMPAGTALAISTRTGNTPTPDGSWTAFDPLGNGGSIGATTRYVQYQATLSTTAPGYVTPELDDLAIACAGSGPDVTPPVISAVVATPGSNGTTAAITWTTDESATSRVDYGLDDSSLGSTASDGTLVHLHSLNLTGLTAGLTYYYRVRSSDAAANEAISPNPPAAPLSFMTPLQSCVNDVTDTDFNAGTFNNTSVSLVADGEVILTPTVVSEFPGSALPASWTSILWSDGSSGGTTVASGQASVDGARLSLTSTSGYGPGTVFECVATFGAAAFQHAGFAAGDNTTGGGSMFGSTSENWAMFSTAATTNTLFARLNLNGTLTDDNLGTSLIGTSHRFRIEWRADSVVFLVDGASVDRRAIAIGGTMRPAFSDFGSGGPTLQVDWARLTPYAASGTFLSRVVDSGQPSSWGAMSWHADVPGGTTLVMSVRKGNTPVPDGSWSAFAPVPSSGSAVGGIARYIQYSAAMTANTTQDQTPSLADVSITCGGCSSGSATVIADLAATGTGNAGNGRANVKVSWSGTGAGDQVAVYRKGFGDYPLYRTAHGGAPAAPATPGAASAAGWTLTSVTSSGTLDAPPTRDYWYYVAFVTNVCGVVSAPSNRTAGTLDYILGDVSNGLAVCAGGGEAGDGVVSTPDLSALGAAYGMSFPATDDRTCLDVGPTVDFGARSLPTPDGRLDFDDLVIYALNYEVALPSATTIPRASMRATPSKHALAGREAVSIAAPPLVHTGETFEVLLHLQGSGSVHALSAHVTWDAATAQFLGATSASMLDAAGGLVMVPKPGTIDAAVFGRTSPGFTGEGDVAVVRFRALHDGDPKLLLETTIARDADNHAVSLEVTEKPTLLAPSQTLLGPVFPNPFQSALNVSFALARDTHVSVVVFDVAGRIVRHVDDGLRSAGLHVVTWDGRGDGGDVAPPGFYIVRFDAGEIRQNRRVQLIR